MPKIPEKIEKEDGTIEWRLEGKLHREDGPAVVRQDGVQQWWVNGERHREDGPAFIEEHEMKQWWVQGLLHREDGPAIKYEDSSREWYLGGMPVDESVVLDAGKRAEFLKKRGCSELRVTGLVQISKTASGCRP